MNKVVKKILNVIIDVIVIFILIISIVVITLSLTSKSSGVPNLFGYAPLSVQSDSMKPEFVEGDLIISKVADGSETLKVGDVVSFQDEIGGEYVINTHRISRIEEDPDTKVQKFYTKGDNAPEEDENYKLKSYILAVYTGTKITGLGKVLGFLRTQLGFFLCILLPMILFFVYEAIRVILNIIAYNKAKAAELAAEQVANSELTEEQKKRAIEEYLAQQNKQTEEPKQDSEPEVQTPASEDALDPDSAAEDTAAPQETAETADSE